MPATIEWLHGLWCDVSTPRLARSAAIEFADSPAALLAKTSLTTSASAGSTSYVPSSANR